VKRPIVVNINDSSFDIHVGRPSPWGNPFLIGRDGTREEVIAKYREHVLQDPDLMKSLHTLAGLRLGCFCHPKPCHADVLADLVEQLPEPT
jgi:hypothetical protein